MTFYIWKDAVDHYGSTISQKGKFKKTFFFLPAIAVVLFTTLPCIADDNMAEAQDIGVLSGSFVTSGYVGNSDVQDFYKFSVSGSVTSVTFRLSGYSGRATLNLYEDKNHNYIIDSGEELDSAFGGATKSFNEWLDPGTYYLRVYDYDPDIWYTLTLQETAEPYSAGRKDNSLRGAVYLGTLMGSINVYDWVGNSDYEDYYSFTLAGSRSSIAVSLGGYSGRANLELYEDKNNNYIIDSGEKLASSFGSATRSISQSLGCGIYYVRVFKYDGDIWYGLTLQGEQVDVGPPGEPPSDYYFLGNREDLCGSGADPVNTATGNFFHQETDLSIASRGRGLALVRSYNSKDNRVGPLGRGWTHYYNIVLSNNPSSGLVSVQWGDGKTDYWNPNGQGGYEPNTPGLYDTLTRDIFGNWVVKAKNLDMYLFDTFGRLLRIVDKNGNTFTLDYDHPTNPYLLTSVTDPLGRALTLTYYDDGLIANISDFSSPLRQVTYVYTNGRLTEVIDVMGNNIYYDYNPVGYLETVTDQRGSMTSCMYDMSGGVIGQMDGNGNITLFYYGTPEPNQTTIVDANDNIIIHTHITGYKLLQSIKNSLGLITYYYDPNMNRTAIVDRNGNTTFFSYDRRGNVIEKRDPDDPADPTDGGVTTIEYGDANFPDLPTRKTDALGNITQWKYDIKGNVERQTNPDGNDINWTYNSFGQKKTETNENENTTTYIYDSNGLLTEIIDPNGNHEWYGYDSLWRLTYVTDARGGFAGDPDHTTVTEYDGADRAISVDGPLTSESYQYDEIGNRIHVINGRGFTTLYEYDYNNNLTKIERFVLPGPNKVTQYAYDALNRKISETDPCGNVTKYKYDAGSRLIETTDPAGNKVSYTYDAHGNLLSATDGSGVTIFYEYDTLQRKVHQYDELNNHWYWQYDKLGRQTKYTDATGSITKYGYDELGRLISVTDDANNTTEYKYDAVGNLTQVKDAVGKIIIKKCYDEVNRLIRQEDGLGNTYEYHYDGSGNLIWMKDANGNITTRVYDNENRFIETHYSDSNQVIFSYDENDNLETITDPTGTTTFVYDELDRLISSTDSFGKQVLYGYDLVGNRTSIAYPGDSSNPARIVTYTYDRANRLDKVIDWDGRVWNYTIDGAGRITDVNYPNGIRELRTYDDAGRLSSLIYKNSSDANLITYHYTRDGHGNPTEIKETGTLEPVLDLPLKEDYTYDKDNRLTETTKPATYGYDNNGNMTSRVSGGVTTTLSYDFENRLISQTTGSSTIQHIYDGRGNRIARNDNGLVTRYVLDRGRSMSHILCETDHAGNIIAYYLHGPQILARIGSDGYEHYYHIDHIGSVVALTDETETITDRYVYTPFGVPAGHEGTTLNPFTYVGGMGVMEESDSLYFMRTRFYDTESGRFINKDPIGGVISKPLSYNAYLYASNRPNVLIDPMGLIDETQQDFIVTFIKFYAGASNLIEEEDYYSSGIYPSLKVNDFTGYYFVPQRDLSILGKVNIAKRYLDVAIAANKGESGTVLWNLVAIGQHTNLAITALELVNLLPKIGGAPYTAVEAWLGPEAAKLKFDFAYGLKESTWNIAYGMYHLNNHQEDMMNAYHQFWWLQPTVWGYDLGNFLLSHYTSTLLEMCNKNAKGQ